jgi:hypothetical protein
MVRMQPTQSHPLSACVQNKGYSLRCKMSEFCDLKNLSQCKDFLTIALPFLKQKLLKMRLFLLNCFKQYYLQF